MHLQADNPQRIKPKSRKTRSQPCSGIAAEVHFSSYNIYMTLTSTYKVNDRQTPQVTPQSATLPCQNTMVTLTSRESTVQDQLTPKFPIKHKSKTSVFTPGSQFTPRPTLPLARSTCKVCGWMAERSFGRGGGGPRNEVCPGRL